MMVQRTLAACSLSHAQGGTVFAGYLKLLPIFLIVIPGMISRVLFTGECISLLTYCLPSLSGDVFSVRPLMCSVAGPAA